MKSKKASSSIEFCLLNANGLILRNIKFPTEKILKITDEYCILNFEKRDKQFVIFKAISSGIKISKQVYEYLVEQGIREITL